MQPKMIAKICVDTAMTVMLLFLMAYEMIGEAAHEWLGISIFVLFVIHHVLNRKWCSSLLKGRYTLFRIWQTALILGVFLTMLGSMISGIIISRSVLSFLPISGATVFWTKSSYDFGILGICTDVPSFGAALEHDDGNGEKSSEKADPYGYMVIAGDRIPYCGLWCLCFLKKGYWNLHADAEPLCVFRLRRTADFLFGGLHSCHGAVCVNRALFDKGDKEFEKIMNTSEIDTV